MNQAMLNPDALRNVRHYSYLHIHIWFNQVYHHFSLKNSLKCTTKPRNLASDNVSSIWITETSLAKKILVSWIARVNMSIWIIVSFRLLWWSNPRSLRKSKILVFYWKHSKLYENRLNYRIQDAQKEVEAARQTLEARGISTENLSPEEMAAKMMEAMPAAR